MWKQTMNSTSQQHCARSSSIVTPAHVGRRSCLPVPVQVVCTGTDLQPTREASRLWLPPCTHTSTLKIDRSKPLSYYPAQQKCTLHKLSAIASCRIRLRISVYRKWALRLKILILYNQKRHRTKFLNSRKWINPPLFWLSGSRFGPPLTGRVVLNPIPGNGLNRLSVKSGIAHDLWEKVEVCFLE